MAIQLGSVIEQLEEAREAANRANEQRYKQGLSALRKGRESLRQYFDTAQQNIQNIGQAATEEIDRSAKRNYATGRQGLISSGLGNTTITSSLQRGVEDDRQRQLRAVDEQRQTAIAGLSERRAGAEFQAAGAISDFIAARDDIGPDVGLYSSLIEKAQSRPTHTFTGVNRTWKGPWTRMQEEKRLASRRVPKPSWARASGSGSSTRRSGARRSLGITRPSGSSTRTSSGITRPSGSGTRTPSGTIRPSAFPDGISTPNLAFA